MIGFLDVSKSYAAGGQTRCIINKFSQLFDPYDRVGILAAPGSGKSILLGMLCGLETPSSGSIVRQGLVWPIGHCGPLHPGMTGEANVRSVAAFLGLDADEIAIYCQLFSELGDDFHMPLRFYSGSMRARLGFALSMALPVTTFVSDEMVSTGDAGFRSKCDAALQQRLTHAGLILFTRNPQTAQRLCSRHGLLQDGRIEMCATAQGAATRFAGQTSEFSAIVDLMAGLETI